MMTFEKKRTSLKVIIFSEWVMQTLTRNTFNFRHFEASKGIMEEVDGIVCWWGYTCGGGEGARPWRGSNT